jgi:ATP-dependent protease ClpP protease subunit
MINIDIFSDIGNKDDKIFFSFMGMEDAICTAETIKEALDSQPDDPDVTLNMHCDGGSVYEGLAMYDMLRMSGKNVHANIVGSCHSMAICILLAAPKNQRTGNTNLRALIHQVRMPVHNDLTADELRELADSCQQEEDAILDIYEERTGYNKERLRAIMKEEKVRTANDLLKWGFISKINSYSTNKFSRKMSKNNGKGSSLKDKVKNFLNKARNLLAEPVNYDYLDTEGNVVFSTESETDTLAVGDTVVLTGEETGGTFELDDGRIVTIEDNVVTAIDEPSDLEAENESLREALNEATELINQLQAENEKLRNDAGSFYKPRNRTQTPKTPGGNKSQKRTGEEAKNEAREKLAKLRGQKNGSNN